MIWFQKKSWGPPWRGQRVWPDLWPAVGEAWSGAGAVRQCIYIEHLSGEIGRLCSANSPDRLSVSIDVICTLNIGPWTTVNGTGIMPQNIGVSTEIEKRRFWRDDVLYKDLTTGSRQNIDVLTAILEAAKGIFQIWKVLGLHTTWTGYTSFYVYSVINKRWYSTSYEEPPWDIMQHNLLIINQLHKPLLLQSFHENTAKIGVPHYDIHNSLILNKLPTIVPQSLDTYLVCMLRW